MKLPYLLAALALLGLLRVALACGRTGIDLVEIGSDGGTAGGPPSCSLSGSGLTDCGAARESCCRSLEVEGGMYYRTYSNSGNGPTGEADPATVSSFRLDKYLVTVGRFRQFVKAWDGAAGYYPPTGSGKHTYLNGGLGLANSAIPGTFEAGWVASDNIWIAPEDANLAATPYCSNYATWTAMAGGQESLPINCVTWQEAYAFCIWDGGFLPSEAEWGYAAAGGNQQREYPWGSAAPGATNQYAIYGCDYPSDSKLGCFAASVAPVGTTTLGVGRWGQLDLTGEVFEWNLDWYASYRNPCTNCAYLEETVPGLVSRGGSFYVGAQTLQSSLRFSDLPSYFRDFNIGFRCARAP